MTVRTLTETVLLEWVDWPGFGRFPDEGRVVELKFRNGDTAKTSSAPGWRWSDTGDDYDIVAYRVLK